METNKILLQNNKIKRNVWIAAIVVVCLVAATLVSILWQSHIRQLRTDMQAYLANSITHIERGRNELALTEATAAKSLAQQLRDDDYLNIIIYQIRLIDEVSLGSEFFANGRYQSARAAYEWALDYATNIDNLNPAFIEDLIYITDGHIYFFELMEDAFALVEQANLEGAVTIYENAFLLAASLSFSEGEALASDGISDTMARIIEQKRASAASFEALGEVSFSNSDYMQAIIHFQYALEIYEDLSDLQNIELITARIDLAKHKIEEARLARERLEQERLEQQLAEQARQRAEAQTAAQPPIVQENPTTDTDTQGSFDVNYAHNRSIDFDMVTLIDNQNQSPANLILMGNTPGLNEGWYNGCGWIAAYNALIILGNPIHPAEIVNHFETNRGAVMGGVLGTFPHAIERFFAYLEYDVTHTLFPQRSANLDDIIRASRVSILAYTHTRAAHFIAIEYHEDLGMFIVYNDSFARRRNTSRNLGNHTDIGTAIDSINSLIRYTPEILFSFSLITID